MAPDKNWSKELELLRIVLKRKQDKEDIPGGELEALGLKPNCRVKDIEKEIKNVRAKISSSNKTDLREAEEQEIIKEAEALGIPLDEYKEQIKMMGRVYRQKELMKDAGKKHSPHLNVIVQKQRDRKTGDGSGESDRDL